MDLYKSCLTSMKSGKFDSNEYRNEIKNIVNNSDESGRSLLHWAAFLGCKDAVSFLLESGANTALICEKDENFQAIHFAAVNNHTDCIKLLVDKGVSTESCDLFQRSPLSVACFYGRINTTVFLLSQKANVDHRDINGNTALHFAAMSRNVDLCQILIYSGINARITNNHGETAFHLACNKGSTRMIKSFLTTDPLLMNIIDKKGMTGLNHCKLHHNYEGLHYLSERIRKSSEIFPRLKSKDLIYGGGSSKYPLIFLVGTIFFWGIPTYIRTILFITYTDWPLLNITFITVFLCFMICFYASNKISPGYLPRYTKQYDDVLKAVSVSGQSEFDILVTLSRLCHTCRTVRPLRAFHCGICKRCIRDKDHHCPYIYNCVGFKNRQYFLLFLIFLWIDMFIAIFLSFIVHFDYGYYFLLYEYFGLLLLTIFFVFVNFMLLSCIYCAFYNITTNESIKWKSYGYDYLRDDQGNFKNSLNKGFFINFLQFFRIIILFKKSPKLTFDI